MFFRGKGGDVFLWYSSLQQRLLLLKSLAKKVDLNSNSIRYPSVTEPTYRTRNAENKDHMKYQESKTCFFLIWG